MFLFLFVSGSLASGFAEPGCKVDAQCPQGYRCAKWVFKKNECVQTCQLNAIGESNCPAGQVCRKPFGTHFYRCVNG
jgi:hypothetical protein